MTVKIDQIADAIISVPGVSVQIVADSPSGTETVSAAVYEDINVNFTSLSVVVPVAGTYLLQLKVGGIYSTAADEVRFRILVSSSPITTDSKVWEGSLDSQRNNLFLQETVELAAGSNVFTIQWQRASGSGNVTVDTTSNLNLRATLLSGSGAGGIIAQRTSHAGPTQISGTDSPWSPQFVSDLAVTVNTFEGESVYVTLEATGTGAGYSGTTMGMFARIFIDDTQKSYAHVQTSNTQYWADNLAHSYLTEGLSAGTHTITFGFSKYDSSQSDWDLSQAKVQVIQFRGGQVPVEKDAVQVLDTPRALNFTGDNVQVTNVSNKANIAFNGVSDGLEVNSTAGISNYTETEAASTWHDILKESAGASMSITFSVLEGETVFFTANYGVKYIAANADVYSQFKINIPSVASIGMTTVGSDAATVGDGSEIPVTLSGFYTFATAGTYTATMQYYKSDSSISLRHLMSSEVIFSAVRYKGGYIQPDNFPILEYSSASQINVKSAPGASSVLQAILNDGIRYRATSPLTVDLTVSGLGGLDTGSEASSTWYYIYLVPSATSGVFSVVASITDPASGGPTGYDIYRYIGTIRNDSSSNILEFYQKGDRFFLAQQQLPAAFPGTSSWISSWTNYSIADVVPLTADFAYCQQYVNNSSNVSNKTQVLAVVGTSVWYHHCAFYAAYQYSEVNLWYPTPGTSKTLRIQNYTWGGSASLTWQEVSFRGWLDGYLAEAAQLQAQAPYQPDTKSPKGTWATTSTVSFAARPGQPSTIRLTPQDGKQRTMSTGTFDISNGVADWGYDEAASQGNSKWLYFYAVPKSGDDNSLVIRASDNPLSTGPTGYSNYKVVWKTYIDGSGNLINVVQRNNEFQYYNQSDGVIYSGNGAGYIEPETSYASVDLSGQVPVGASEVQFKCYIDVSPESPAAYWTILWSLDGTNGHRALGHRGDTSVNLNAQNVWYMAITSSRTIYRKRQRDSGSLDLGWVSYVIHSWVDEEIDS